MVIRREARPGATGVLTFIAVLLLATGCSTELIDGRAVEGADTSTSAEQTTGSAPATTTVTASGVPAAERALTRVDAGAFAAPQNPGAYAWNYSTGGGYGGLCVSGGETVTCTGTPAASVPDLTQHFPGRPGAVELGEGGLRYTFVEGVPPVSARLETGQEVQIGALRCAKPDDATIACSSGSNSFTISGPDRTIATSGTVLAERDLANFPDSGPTAGSQSSDASTATDQPSEYIGASRLVSGVRTASGRLVTASTPPCDGRGILILDSYVETSQPQQGIAALLDRHPSAEFATPGHCPSLRAALDGARVYPIYTDHGHDTAALCRDKAARGGNARLLTDSAAYSDPC